MRTPAWLKWILSYIVKPILKGVGEYIMADIRKTIIAAAGHTDWDNETKFKFVYGHIKSMYKDVGENALGIAIKVCLAELKEKKLI